MTRRRLSHVDARGRARMVDVGAKRATPREAIARGEVRMSAEAFDRIRENRAAKGDVLAVAQIAGIQAAKRTSDLIPLCHPLTLDGVAVTLEPDPALPGVSIEARVRCRGATGVEMEALCAVAVAGLAVYDMIKAVDRGAILENVRLVAKSGGKSGKYRR